MPYDHCKKAGNQGDVVKHVALVAAARHALAATSGKFSYVDAFAGRAGSLLLPGGEWMHGIGRLDRTAPVQSPDLRDWLGLYLARPQLVGSRYPGSALMVWDVATSAGRSISMTLWDISEAAVKDLKQVFPKQRIFHSPVDPSAKAVRQADFLFIDPPAADDEWSTLRNLMACGKHMLAWMPVNAAVRRGSVGPSARSDQQHEKVQALEGVSGTRVLWARGGRTIGCLLAYRSSAEGIAAIRLAVDEVVSRCNWPFREVFHTP